MNPPRLTEDVLALIEKTNLIQDTTMEDRAKGIRGTRVEVVLKNGDKIEETVLVPRGDPEKPLTIEDIIDKLRVCAKGQADEETLMKLVDEIKAIGGNKQFINPMRMIGVAR